MTRWLAIPAAMVLAVGGGHRAAGAADADPWLMEVFDGCWAAAESGALDPLDAYALEMKVDGKYGQYWYTVAHGPLGSVNFEVEVQDGTVVLCRVYSPDDSVSGVPFEDAEPTIAAWRTALSETEGFHEIVPGRRVVEVSRCPADGVAVSALIYSTSHPEPDSEAWTAGSDLPFPGLLLFSAGRIPEPGLELHCGQGEHQ